MQAINIYTYKGRDYVYCGRGKGGVVPDEPFKHGWLGNPVAVGKPCPECGETHKDGGATLDCYSKILKRKLQGRVWRKAFYETCYGKNLGCFCHPKPCHTGVMISALKKLRDLELHAKEGLLSGCTY